MNRGSQFVETLKTIGYPKADRLNGEDFDWLFETEEDRLFLEWFCSSGTEQNILSEHELKAFESLRQSGKPVLDEKDLDHLFKTCKSTNSEHDKKDELVLEELELEELEKELQAQVKLKNKKIQRRNKLQMLASASSHVSVKLDSKKEEALKVLKEVQEALSVENAKINNELQNIIEGAKQLTAFYCTTQAESEFCVLPVFLSQLTLEKYLQQEEESTNALTSYAKKQFFEGISDLVESSNEENFQLLDASSPSVQEEDNEIQTKWCHEMTRLQLAYIAAQYRCAQLKAKQQSNKFSLQCVQENLHSLQKNKVPKKEEVVARISDLKKELLEVDHQMEQINSELLPALIRESARLLNMPIVKGDLDLQITRQNYYISRQDEMCSYLTKQKASFELLQLAYELEFRRHRGVHRQLENLTKELEQSRHGLDCQLEVLSDPVVLQNRKPRNTVDSRDSATQRLHDLLDLEGTQQQLFRTYSGLEKAAQNLQQDVVSLQDQVALCDQERSHLLSKLVSDTELLKNALFSGPKQLLLNSQELAEPLHHLESQLDKLNKIVLDILDDIKAKRKILETNKLDQLERELYLYFFKEDSKLKDATEKLEAQVRAQSIGTEN